MRFQAPAPKYIGPAAHTSRGANKPVRRIVLHSTVSPCRSGQARKTAEYFRSENSGGSAHYAVDPYETIQCVLDSVIAWHAPPNPGSLGVEMCEYPHPTNLKRWNDAEHRLMFRRAARLVAELCLAYDVPPYYAGAVSLKLGRRGVTTHAQVSKAWRQSTHWDPGAWPRVKFMREVRRQVKLIKAGKA